ncbi:MAG: formylglycine-generating enzyme family protein, partial [Taibaiella sp.]|nr:formylglycine-generating enzyme family protein [Taibaiella sp.]
IGFATFWGFSTPNHIGNLTVEASSIFLPDMIDVPSGTFVMGEPGHSDEHIVTLTNSFLLGRTTITNDMFVSLVQWAYDNSYCLVENDSLLSYGELLLDMSTGASEVWFDEGQFALRGSNSHFALETYPEGYDPTNHPVGMLTFYGAACFCDWLSLYEGLDPYYQGNWDQTLEHNPYFSEGYRLPTSAEWEYAVRYNDGRMYPWGNSAPNCSYLNYAPNNRCVGWTNPVNSYPLGISGLGFSEMAGNVWELTGDWAYGSNSDATNPLGGLPYQVQKLRVGGSFALPATYHQTWHRDIVLPTAGVVSMGLRICRTAP